jgi:putative peptidoglycan lipid II flippase
MLIASGIFLSRIFGFLRERAIAHYFGNSDLADAFKAAYRIPNFLQNLLGEGVLSASFIPVYAQLVSLKKEKEAHELAASIFWLLFGVVFSISIFGVLFAPQLIPFIAPGFQGEKLTVTIKLVQILFPGTALLVMSAWCLGILNTHSRFFLSYSAPVIWNLTQIAVLLFAAQRFMGFDLIASLAWSILLGSLLQFLIQLPQVFKFVPSLWPKFELSTAVRTVIRNFFPVLFSRGVVQVSAYVDIWLASLLPTGAVSSMSFAQMLYLLPVSLFGMSISAAELPAM